MTQFENLIEFENKYPGLYDIEINGLTIYTVMRQALYGLHPYDATFKGSHNNEQNKKYISIKRIIKSFVGFYKYKKSKTLIFTSSSFRRDHLRNLSIEYLQEIYKDSVVFEWPNHNQRQDVMYIYDKNCVPIDFYLVLSKIFVKFSKKKYQKMYNICLGLLNEVFKDEDSDFIIWIEYLKIHMCTAYAYTGLSHIVFSKLFKKYSPERVIDFFGSARENIYPVFKNKPELIELQHGILTKEHTGYVYPNYLKNKSCFLFNRKIFVYGKSSKDILCNYSIFNESQIKIIGNPRIEKYFNIGFVKEERNLILFTSQPFEQDGLGNDYYNTIIPSLKKILYVINNDDYYCRYSLAIKLHPREGNSVIRLYKKHLGKDVFYYENDSELYDLLAKSYLHITVSSTCLYEAAEFNCPTLTIKYKDFNNKETYGKKIKEITNPNDVSYYFKELKINYDKYLKELKEITKEFM